MSYLLFRYLHFIAIFVFAGALVIENMAIKPIISGEDARNLAKVDAFYGASAALVAVFGLVLWFGVGKPSAFYSMNSIFHIKLALFVSIALLSIYPTVFFIKNRKSVAESIVVPTPLRALLRVQLVILCILPVLAFLMARGIGLNA